MLSYETSQCNCRLWLVNSKKTGQWIGSDYPCVVFLRWMAFNGIMPIDVAFQVGTSDVMFVAYLNYTVELDVCFFVFLATFPYYKYGTC